MEVKEITVMIDEWRPVKGFEGIYEISNVGRVKSLERKTRIKRMIRGKIQEFTFITPEKILKQGVRPDGYFDVPLTKAGVTKVYCIHRLVAEAFLENSKNLPCVNHKDCNIKNNDVNNLEWCTFKHNSLHAVYKGRNKQAIKIYCEETGLIYPSISEACRQLHVSYETIKDSLDSIHDTAYHFSLA